MARRCRALVQLNSNNVLVAFNILTAVLAVGVVAAAAWLATKSSKDCLSFLHWPFMAVGLLIFGVAALGAWAASRRRLAALGVYGAAILVLVLAFAGLTLFAVIVTLGSGGGVRPLPPAHFREYTTSDFSPWLQSRVRPPYWDTVSACLARSRLCTDLDSRYKSLRQLYSADLSPTQGKFKLYVTIG